MVWSVANYQVTVPFVTHKRLGVFSCLLVFLPFPPEKQEQEKNQTSSQFRGNWPARVILLNNKFVLKRFGVVASCAERRDFPGRKSCCWIWMTQHEDALFWSLIGCFHWDPLYHITYSEPFSEWDTVRVPLIAVYLTQYNSSAQESVFPTAIRCEANNYPLTLYPLVIYHNACMPYMCSSTVNVWK